ncbi:MAG: class I SAM-dependent methyltransferase [Chloroflexi bacterium]|nr:class I SAM-dependent methyltransferase [Chloroflexota bacterium]
MREPFEAFRKETYGDRISDVYDDLHSGPAFDPAAEVAVLAELAHGGKVLELGIGTGRVALPLSKAGVEVHGIDASVAMVAKLRTKRGGRRIPVTIGDFADVPVTGKFDLVFVAFNTFYGLTTQEQQIRCFQNVARRLKRGGLFLVRGFVPDLTRFQRGQSMTATRVELNRVTIDVSKHDPVTQTVDAQQIWITESGNRMFPVRLRYVWPSELDLMAQLAGMRLRDRWGNWDKSPYTAASQNHISVYEMATAGR